MLVLGWFVYQQLESEFLPPMDEGGFVIDYVAPCGSSLTETDRQLLQAEAILTQTPEVDSYSRRTGARLALAIAEPNTGDFLVKLKADRQCSTDDAVNTAMLGQQASTVLDGDRVVNICVVVDSTATNQIEALRELPIRAADGTLVKLSQVADLREEAGQRELRREDLRQDVAVTARLEGRDLGSAMQEIQALLRQDPTIAPGTLEFGMLDFVANLRVEGASLEDALVRSGHRRLRPVLMTSLAAAFGMLPLAWGIGAGSDMLQPLAIAVIGALCISVLLSLIATPSIYYVLVSRARHELAKFSS